MPDLENWGQEDPAFYGKLISVNGEEENREKTIETINGNYMAFYDSVYESLIKNNPPAITAEQGRNVIFIIEKAFESDRDKCVIRINNE